MIPFKKCFSILSILTLFATSTAQAAKKEKAKQKTKAVMSTSQTDIKKIITSYSPKEPQYFQVIKKMGPSHYYIELVNSRTNACQGKRVTVTDNGLTYLKRTWPCKPTQ